jgi:hypothetical protein
MEVKPELSSGRIFFAPLHWGLGHVSRCVPLIRHAAEKKFKITVGVHDPQKTFLQGEIPGIETINVPALEVRFGQSRIGTMARLFSQGIRLPGLVKEEEKWLKEYLLHEPQDLIVSDNRYGMHDRHTRSVIITHQLKLQGLPFEHWSKKLIRKLLLPFDEVWIPDFENRRESLAGVLSENEHHELNIRYIGPLSRFANHRQSYSNSHLLFLISGPEPQRSMFERLAVETALRLKEKSVIVRGCMPSSIHKPIDNITFYDMASGKELEPLLASASVNICRSGYSSIMDLLAFRAPAILIPTPGQTEQEYLSKFLNGKHGFTGVPSNISPEQLSKILKDQIKNNASSQRSVQLNQIQHLIK